MLPRNTIPLPAVSARQGRHGHSRMPHHSQPTGTETGRCTIPAEGKVHNPQGHTRCLRQKQGIYRTGSFPFCSGGFSTGASPRRKFSFFHKTRIIYGKHTRGLPNLFGKQFLVNVQKGAVSQKGDREKTAAWGWTYFLPQKWSATGSTDLRSNGLNSPFMNVRNSFLCDSEWK